jgi:N-acetylglutamate synthase-like GNAT family acetyltransferase
MIEVTPARREDAPAIVALVEANRLPLDGLADHLDAAVVARQDGHIVGAAALEAYDEGGLLRSVAVDGSARGAGVGRSLVEAVVAMARARALPALYLLTTTAAGYFLKLGFETIERAEVPASVQQSVEFRSACPASATVMRLRL